MCGGGRYRTMGGGIKAATAPLSEVEESAEIFLRAVDLKKEVRWLVLKGFFSPLGASAGVHALQPYHAAADATGGSNGEASKSTDCGFRVVICETLQCTGEQRNKLVRAVRQLTAASKGATGKHIARAVPPALAAAVASGWLALERQVRARERERALGFGS